MAITKINNYLPGQDLTNLAQNVDLNRLGTDIGNLSVDFSTTPATVTVKSGTIIEVNRNVYLIEADFSFQMSDASHRYITFTDVTTPTFASAPARGLFRADKSGYYQSDGMTRTLNWNIDPTHELFSRIDGSNSDFVYINDSFGNAIRSLTYLSASGPGQVVSDPFIIKKPVTMFLNLTGTITRYETDFIEMEVNSNYTSVTALVQTNLTGTNLVLDNLGGGMAVWLNPGKYRAKIATWPGNTPATDLTVNYAIIGVSGIGVIDSPEVYELL